MYDVFLDGVAMLEDAEMPKNHISAKFFDDHSVCIGNIKQAIETLRGVLREKTDLNTKRRVNKQIKKLEMLIK